MTDDKEPTLEYLKHRRRLLREENRILEEHIQDEAERRRNTCLHENVTSGHFYDECDDCGALF